MNAAKTFRSINILALGATLLALLALALLPAAHASAASITPGTAVLSLSPAKDAQTVPAGQGVYHSYEVQNLSGAPITVYLAVKNNAGWPVGLTANVVEIPAKSAIKFQVKLAVPATTTSESVTTISARVISSSTSDPTLAYWIVQAGPAVADPTPRPITLAN